ncbi:MAG TPA: LytTR family DNA-binding domain-containing protein [Bryobacteraceae bacterium]|jgi:two-component system LytT family response regulator|nr:LytTR family DNA-binding domain-containing protein [Bryobacteraceae bacterium]
MIRVFLVEDEPPALRKLERLSRAEGDLEICGSAGTCAEAIAGIQDARPDVLLLDIRLPDGTGFETAYDEHAVKAFEFAALDYLLKPVSQERFSAAIRRARERMAASPRAAGPRHIRRFLVERLKAAYLLPVEAIRYIAADRNYALLYSDRGEFAVRSTMDALEKRLDPAEFARVSRSAIVRLAAIREVRFGEDHNHTLILHSGEEIGCSKKYWTAALTRLL